MMLQPFLQLSLGQPVGRLRAAPVQLGEGAPRAFVVAYSADAEVDPYVEMFFFPKDTLKLAVVTEEGDVLWRRELGRGVVPGVWFCPVFPFDLDGDGTDEVWFVNNTDDDHPFSLRHRVLERLDARTGETTGQWDWPCVSEGQEMSHTFRFFILGGHVRGEPVLVTAQGTYGDMFLQGRVVRATSSTRPGRRPDLSPRWEVVIERDDPGARGSHMCPVADFDSDGVQKIMWGERCIELDTGREVFCADRESYRGHSDVVQPFLDRVSGDRRGQWLLYTCRESDGEASPRVAAFDSEGGRVWGAVEEGHMDMGWVAHLGDGGEPVAMAIRIHGKTAGPEGFRRLGYDEFVFDALTGDRIELPFSVFGTLPVDLDGDGRHELVRTGFLNSVAGESNGEVLDRSGRVMGHLGADALTAHVGKLLDRPGEQILTYYPDGTVRVWADREAEDTDAALARYSHPFYEANRRLSAVGYNLSVLGGL